MKTGLNQSPNPPSVFPGHSFKAKLDDSGLGAAAVSGPGRPVS